MTLPSLMQKVLLQPTQPLEQLESAFALTQDPLALANPNPEQLPKFRPLAKFRISIPLSVWVRTIGMARNKE